MVLKKSLYFLEVFDNKARSPWRKKLKYSRTLPHEYSDQANTPVKGTNTPFEAILVYDRKVRSISWGKFAQSLIQISVWDITWMSADWWHSC